MWISTYVCRAVAAGLELVASFSTGKVDFNGTGAGTFVVFQGFFDIAASSFGVTTGFALNESKDRYVENLQNFDC